MTGSLLYTTNPKTKEEVILPRFELESDMKKVGILFKRRQFPVAPAFSITANKAQGQTIPGKVAIYLWDDWFSHGQLYMVSSRATHPSRLRYCIKNSVVGTRSAVLQQDLWKKLIIFCFYVCIVSYIILNLIHACECKK